MKCPYCSKEMAKGYFHNGKQPVEWIPQEKSPSRFAFSSSGCGVMLNNHFSLSGYRAEAYYCNVCRVVMSKTEP